MRKLIVAFLLLLSGCTTTQYVPAPEMAPIMDKTQSIYHPQLPAPVGSFPCAENFNCWKIIDLNGVPYKAISHNDSIDFSVWIKERNAYDKKIKEVLCFYRKDLKEDFCSEYRTRNPVLVSNGSSTKSSP